MEEDFFDHMMADDPVNKKSRIVSAFERAKAIHDTKKANGAIFVLEIENLGNFILKILGIP